MDNVQFAAVVGALRPKDFTSSGVPKVGALEKTFAAMFPDEPAVDLNSKERNALWASHSASEAEVAPEPASKPEPAPEPAVAPEGGVVATLLAHDRSDPLQIHINGVKVAEMYCGKPCGLSAEAFAHLQQVPGIEYEENS